jgi:hypothetical protein
MTVTPTPEAVREASIDTVGGLRLKSDETRWAAIVARWSSSDTTTVKSANALYRSSLAPHRRAAPFCPDLAMIEVRIHK